MTPRDKGEEQTRKSKQAFWLWRWWSLGWTPQHSPDALIEGEQDPFALKTKVFILNLNQIDVSVEEVRPINVYFVLKEQNIKNDVEICW